MSDSAYASTPPEFVMVRSLCNPRTSFKAAVTAFHRRDLEARIAAHGYALRYVEYCEDSRTSGFLGQMRGVIDRERREVKIGLKANPTEADMLEILAHELRHLDEPDWDCGNRDVLGRGGPSA